ncbi:unnamed protein product, partial [Notodromas monacha]
MDWLHILFNPSQLDPLLESMDWRAIVDLMKDFILNSVVDGSFSLSAAAVYNDLKANACRLFALKIASSSHWHFDTLLELPLPKQMALFKGLLIEAGVHPTDEVHNMAYFASMSSHQRGSAELFNRWCLRAYVKQVVHNVPLKEAFVPSTVLIREKVMRGNDDDDSEESEEVANRARLAADFLRESVVLTDPRSFLAPECFVVKSTSMHIDWRKAKNVNLNESSCLSYFDLGMFYFLTENFAESRLCFQKLLSLANDLGSESCDNLHLNMEVLRGYAMALNLETGDNSISAREISKKMKLVDESGDFHEVPSGTDVNEKVILEDAFCEAVLNSGCVMWNFVGFCKAKRRPHLLHMCERIMAAGPEDKVKRLKMYVVKMLLRGVPIADLFLEEKKFISPAEYLIVRRALYHREVYKRRLLSSSLPWKSLHNSSGPVTFTLLNSLSATYNPVAIKDLCSILSGNEVAQLDAQKRWKFAFNQNFEHDSWRVYANVMMAKIAELWKLEEFDSAVTLVNSLRSEFPRVAPSPTIASMLNTLEADNLTIQASKLLRETRLNGFGNNPVLENVISRLLTVKALERISRPGLLPTPKPRNEKRRGMVTCLDFVQSMFRLSIETSEEKISSSAKTIWDELFEALLHPNEFKSRLVLNRTSMRPCLVLISQPRIMRLIISLFASLLNAVNDSPLGKVQYELEELWPIPLSRVDKPEVVETVVDLILLFLDYGLTIWPRVGQWIKTRADVYLSFGCHYPALTNYLEFISLSTHFFSVDSSLLCEDLYNRLITCCSALRKCTFAAVMCQYLEDDGKYEKAFRLLRDHVSTDGTDCLYELFWDCAMLEFLVDFHAMRGEVGKMKYVLKLIRELETSPLENCEMALDLRCLKKFRLLRELA